MSARRNKKPLGVYVHVPFCERKCPYCDFYSVRGDAEVFDSYTSEAEKQLLEWGKKLDRTADTLYFGGGTPSLPGAERLSRLVGAAKKAFGGDFREITVEVNPSGEMPDFELLADSGVNRISLGLQSANDEELVLLGRGHTAAQAAKTAEAAGNAGIENISFDLMIALPHQSAEKLENSVRFCAENGAAHISAYILKIEERTVFYKKRGSLSLPDEDEAAELYEALCALARKYGYRQYEISNFCREGYEGQHNLKYWHDEEYIGIGPAAHSFVDGKRFYVPRKMQSFYSGETVADGDGGTEEEYIMLGLRLSEGITRRGFFSRFGRDIPEHYFLTAKKMSRHGLMNVTENGFSLTEKGFLLSNAVIAQMI